MKILRLLSLVLLTGVALGAPALSAVEIRSALYGAGSRNSDVTDTVQRLVSSGQYRIFVGNRTFGFDPLPNVVKRLYVEYSDHGRPFRVEAREGSWLTIRATGGYRPPVEGFDPDRGVAERSGSQVRFVNRYQETVRVYSLNSYGAWEWVTSLAPGARYSTPARPGQSFVVTTSDNQVVSRLRAPRGSETLVIQ